MDMMSGMSSTNEKYFNLFLYELTKHSLFMTALDPALLLFLILTPEGQAHYTFRKWSYYQAAWKVWDYSPGFPSGK